MNDKKLPIQIPPVKFLQYRAFPLAVTSNYEETLPWFCSNFIHLKCNPNYIETGDVALDFIAGDVYGGIPWLDYQEQKNIHSFPYGKMDLCKRVISHLDKNYYFYTFIDEFYIPNKVNYKKNHQMHDIFIYGYHYETEKFNILGYNDQLQFAMGEISFDEFYVAFRNSSIDYTMCLKKIDGIQYDFNISHVKEKLKDYIYSINCSDKLDIYDLDNNMDYKKNMQKHLNCDHYSVGMDIYQCLLSFCESFALGLIEFDMRPFECLLEHKKCMVARIEYLVNHNYLDSSTLIYEEYKTVEDLAVSMKNAILKMSVTRDEKLLDRVVEYLKRMELEERIVLTKLIHNI